MFDPLWSSHAERVIREVEASEKTELMLRLHDQWGVRGSYWFPLVADDHNRPTHIEAFQVTYFEEELTDKTLHRILNGHGITSLFEMRESGQMCEIELDQFFPLYTGLEGFWFTAKLDWLIYASHESSITVGGEWLLTEVKVAWPLWERRIWMPFHQ